VQVVEGRFSKAIEVLVVIGAGAAAVLATVGESTKNPAGWFVAAALSLGVPAFVAVIYFLVHPLFVAADRFRSAKLGNPTGTKVRKRKPRGPLVVERALYGAGDAMADVTPIVAPLVSGDLLTVAVTNEVLGGDPAPNVVKKLIIGYTLDGVPRHQGFLEGTVAELP
jgi:hypothetical protein